MSYYRTCPRCGASLDPGEPCDCDKNLMEDFVHEEDDIKKIKHPEFQRV